MRQRRAKLYRKMMQQYQLQFGFREPFQLLIDDTFALALTRYKIDHPLHQFGNVLQTKKVKPLITQCCMQALYALGKEHQATVAVAKEWERRLCNHREAIDPHECVKQCVGKENKHRYVVASEKGELRRDLRLGVVGVPMMHFTQAVMVLEPMSALTKSRIEEKEDTKLSLPASEAGLLKNQPAIEVDIVGGAAHQEEDKEEQEGESSKAAAEGSRSRKRKAPNPLSVRKPKNPRLTMEEKLKREQELKKQKQRNAARARLEASKLDGKSDSTGADDGAASAQAGSRKKRKRATSKKDTSAATRDSAETTSATPAPNAEAQTQSDKAKESNRGATGGSKRSNKRSRPSAASNGASAEAAVAESSA